MSTTIRFQEAQVYPEVSAISVCWVRREEKNGEPVDTLVRRAYEEGEEEEFVADLENPANGGEPGMAAPYLAELGW